MKHAVVLFTFIYYYAQDAVFILNLLPNNLFHVGLKVRLSKIFKTLSYIKEIKLLHNFLDEF